MGYMPPPPPTPPWSGSTSCAHYHTEQSGGTLGKEDAETDGRSAQVGKCKACWEAKIWSLRNSFCVVPLTAYQFLAHFFILWQEICPRWLGVLLRISICGRLLTHPSTFPGQQWPLWSGICLQMFAVDTISGVGLHSIMDFGQSSD